MDSFDIPVMKPRPVRGEFLSRRINSIAASGIFSNRGPQVLELESRISHWLNVGKERIVVTSNATLALSAAISLSSANRWHLPAWTFPAAAHAPLLLNQEIRLVDITAETWYVRDERATPGTGIINVIPFGGSFGPESWEYPGEVVVDAAASLATKPFGLSSLPDSAVVVFSLHATKTMGGAEGGVAVFGSEERATQARSWINFGFSGSRNSSIVATNGKMSEYDAAVANSRFDGWSDEQAEWTALRSAVMSASSALELCVVPESMEAIGPYWIAVFESGERRNRVRKMLADSGVETRLWWAEGLHLMEAFRHTPKGTLSFVDDVSKRYLGLPFHLDLARDEIDFIGDIIASSA